MFLLAECSRVTVASIPFLVKSKPNGRPTVTPLPSTATCLPLSEISYLRSSSTIPAGVHGTGDFISPETFRTNRPRFTGCNPSASFAGSISSRSSRESIPTGSGS